MSRLSGKTYPIKIRSRNPEDLAHFDDRVGVSFVVRVTGTENEGLAFEIDTRLFRFLVHQWGGTNDKCLGSDGVTIGLGGIGLWLACCADGPNISKCLSLDTSLTRDEISPS